MKYLIWGIQSLLIYLASIGVYSLREHYKNTKKDKPIEFVPFIVIVVVMFGVFYLVFWK